MNALPKPVVKPSLGLFEILGPPFTWLLWVPFKWIFCFPLMAYVAYEYLTGHEPEWSSSTWGSSALAGATFLWFIGMVTWIALGFPIPSVSLPIFHTLP
jgi:hypothetical protein